MNLSSLGTIVRQEIDSHSRLWGWSCVAVTLLTLPNLVAIFLPKPEWTGFGLFIHGLGLMLLPCLFGIRVRRWLYLILPLALLVPPTVACLWYTKMLPSTFLYLALMETNAKELSCFGSQLLPVMASLPVIGLACWWIIHRKIPRDFQLGLVGKSSVIFSVGLFLGIGTLKHGPLGAPNYALSYTLSLFPTGTLYSISEAIHFRSMIDKRIAALDDLEVGETPPATTSDDDRQVHILVLGESARAASFQIYGYDRPTNPRLMKTADLLAFKDVAAAAPITLAAVPQMLTPAEPGQFLDTLKLPSIPAVFRKAGYKVYWISTQPKHGAYDTTSSTFSAEAHEAHFLGGLFDPFNTGAFSGKQDWQVLGLVHQLLARKEPKVLLVLHTMGSHGPYYLRYPKILSRFSVDAKDYERVMLKPILTEAERQIMVDAYDNTIHATDWLLTELIGVLAKQGAQSWFYYVSDHGENMSGTHQFAHGTLTEDVLRIPLFIWTSPAYQQSRPLQWAALRSHVSSPVSASSTFDTVLDLSGLRCPNSRPAKSLASAGYDPGSRRVAGLSGRVWDYDKELVPDFNKRPGGWQPLPGKKLAAAGTAIAP